MEKYVVWFRPLEKKIKSNQIHLLAVSVEDAMKKAKDNINFEHTTMGVGNYRGNDNDFINLKIY